MARIKPEPVVVASLEEAEAALGEMASLERKLGGIQSNMQEDIDQAKARASQAAKPLAERHKALSEAVGAFAILNKDELFKKARSLDLGFGVIGFRLSTRIMQARGVSVGLTLERMKQYGLSEGIRLKEEINKDVCLAWPEERLDLVGLKRQQQDKPYIEIRKDAVPQEAGI